MGLGGVRWGGVGWRESGRPVWGAHWAETHQQLWIWFVEGKLTRSLGVVLSRFLSDDILQRGA